MVFPTNYDSSGLSPIVSIRNVAGTEMYKFESQQVANNNSTPVQQFALTGGMINVGINNDHGTMLITINDNDRTLFDENIIRIKHGWEILLSLGKSPTTVHDWFRGIIDVINVNVQTNTTNIELHCKGWGVLTSYRYSSMNRTQQRLEDNIKPDPADTTTKTSELFKDVLTDTDHLAVPGLGLIDITIGDVQNTNATTSLSDYRKNFVTLGSELNELSQMDGSYYGVSPDKTAFQRKRGSVSSNFLLTDDVNNDQSTNWDTEKIMFIKNTLLVESQSTENSGYTILHGLGSQRLQVDYSQLLANAGLDLSTNHYAFPFDPKKDNVSQVSLFLAKNSVITKNLQVLIVGADTNDGPDLEDVRETKIILANKLNKELTSTGKFIDIKFNRIAVTKNERLFIVIRETSNATQALQLSYQTNTHTDTRYYTSSDLVHWDRSNPGGAGKFITYQAKYVKITGQNTSVNNEVRPKEGIITLPDHPDEQTVLQIFETILQDMGKPITNYQPIIVTPPTLPIEIGKTIQFHHNGTNRELSVVGYSLQFNAFNENNLGANEISIILQE